MFLALALANRPRVVFLDELTQGLDPAARRATWQLIERVREHGTTVVLVTHHLDEAERLCDRVGVLQSGRLTACATPQALIAEAGGTVRVRFSCAATAGLDGLGRVPGVAFVHHDGQVVDIEAQAAAVVAIAGELLARNLHPTDFAVIRPSLEDVFVALTEENDSCAR